MKYYLAICKCGHVGRTKYVEKAFPLKASSKKEVAKIARQKGRVKHDDKYAIRSVVEISEEEYLKQLKIHHSDQFFKVHSVQEQRARCPEVYNLVQIEKQLQPTYKRKNEKRRLVENSLIKEMNKHKTYKNYE